MSFFLINKILLTFLVFCLSKFCQYFFKSVCNRISSLKPLFSKNLDEIYEKVFQKGFIGFYQDFEVVLYTSFSWF